MSVRSVKAQYDLIDERFSKRLELIPSLMDEQHLDFWIILAKEYNEDPMLAFLTPTSFPTARRITALVFHRSEHELKRLHFSRSDPHLNQYYTPMWDERICGQFESLAAYIKAVNPSAIGINISDDFAIADGLSYTLYQQLIKYLSPKDVEKLVPAQNLCISFLQKRLPDEMVDMKQANEIALNIIDRTFSKEFIEVGKTTASDLEWVMKQLTYDLGLQNWFFPTVDIQRAQVGILEGDEIIEAGDILHCDFGLTYLNMCTDTQRLAYVLKTDETDIPDYLIAPMKINNRFQDIVTSHLHVGETGNTVFRKAITEGKAAGIDCILYTHPIGLFGHGPGPTIGLYNEQKEIPIKGDCPIVLDTCYALELTTRHYIPEWGIELAYMSEETISYTQEGIHYFMPGRTKIKKI